MQAAGFSPPWRMCACQPGHLSPCNQPPFIRDIRIASPITRSSGLVTLMFSRFPQPPRPNTPATPPGMRHRWPAPLRHALSCERFRSSPVERPAEFERATKGCDRPFAESSIRPYLLHGIPHRKRNNRRSLFFAAATTSAIIRSVTNGRTASCISTISVSEGT